ncbi:MAG TPA: hypothetical protein PK152_13130 [Anaerolineales bacterium]|jgi:hypothetical protein|nr:hypothetical protein [Anaerolineales bacterium]HRK90072.1 hypothetical protein [Anaerolineales bacterium]
MKHETFKSYVAVLVAVVTVLGATAACLASVAVSSASDADFLGLDASIRAQKADIINHVYAFEHYRAYTDYVRYDEYGRLLYDPNADEETDLRNGALQREAWGVASGLSSVFFSPRYINPDGQYDLERELQEAWAQDSQNEDLNPTPYFAESDQLRARSSFLTADMIVLAISFWFLTVAQATEKKIKYFWAGLGILFALAGILGIIIGRFLI